MIIIKMITRIWNSICFVLNLGLSVIIPTNGRKRQNEAHDCRFTDRAPV